MRKIILSFIIALILFFSNASGVYAADGTISCNDSSCTPAVSAAIFLGSEIWYPGMEVTKTVQITNTHSVTQTVGTRAENTSTTGFLDTVLLLTIKRQSDSATLYSGTLGGFYSSGEISLTTIGSSNSDTISFTISLPINVDNTYQDKTTIFDLVLGFFPTSTPPSTPSGTNGGSGGGSSGTPSTHESSTPAQAAVQFIQGFISQAFGEILGEQDNIGTAVSTRSAEVLPLESILGSTLSCERCEWWPFMLGELAYLVILVLVGRRRQWSKKHYLALSVLLGIVVQLLFWWWNRNCFSSNWFCQYFWLLNTMAVSIFSLFYKKKE